METITRPSLVFPPAWAGGWGEDRFGVFTELAFGGAAFSFRWIPSGTFQMGSPDNEKGRSRNEGPRHPVTISQGYWLADTPCTQAQWIAITGENLSRFKKGQTLDRPAEHVSWKMVLEFCQKLTERVRRGLLEAEEVFRLPTEAEWEYACRVGTDTAFNDGSDCTEAQGKDPALDRLGWFLENSIEETHPVGEKAPNAWGLYDMHGNVWEWCLDGRREYSQKPETDPLGPTDESAWRALRGGSIWDDAGDCRSACRSGNDPGFRDFNVGFRLASGQPPGSGSIQSRSEGRA
jgi:formylglycine-generating enzyme